MTDPIEMPGVQGHQDAHSKSVVSMHLIVPWCPESVNTLHMSEQFTSRQQFIYPGSP